EKTGLVRGRNHINFCVCAYASRKRQHRKQVLHLSPRKEKKVVNVNLISKHQSYLCNANRGVKTSVERLWKIPFQTRPKPGLPKWTFVTYKAIHLLKF